MKRLSSKPRPNWTEKAERLGFIFHSLDDVYWDETAYYSFNYSQIDVIETATNHVYELVLKAVEYIIEKKQYHLLKIPSEFIPLIERSWDNDEPAIYGRFDFCYDGKKPPRVYEFNADTPTSLYEASIVQWFWLQDVAPDADQFNSIHEKLIDYWKMLRDYLKPGLVHFTCIADYAEDLVTTQYMRDCAIQAGLQTEFVPIQDVGWDRVKEVFVDKKNYDIKNIFKLYPYEWLIKEDFGKNLLIDRNKTFWIEPAWKMLVQNKGLWAVMWKLFPHCPYLLPTYFDNKSFDSNTYVTKPFFSREGANISILQNGNIIAQTEGEYGSEGYVYQAYYPLPSFNGKYPLIGSWVIGGEAAGIGIRESKQLITDNVSTFVPHLIVKI